MTNEMALLVAVCAPAPDRGVIADALDRPLNPAQFMMLVERHRVAGHAYHGLGSQGVKWLGDHANTLIVKAHETARRGVLHASETLRLYDALEAAGVTILVLKGASLAMLAHKSLTTKMSWDIDLLIAAEQLAAAASVLTKADYACVIPGPETNLARWHRFFKDSTWQHKRTKISIELHTELTENPAFLLPGLSAQTSGQAVELAPGRSVQTFLTEELFAYLCVHGALSGWRRLKWLIDLAGILQDANAGTIVQLHRAAHGLGVGRSATQGIALSARFFKTPFPDEIAARVAEDWKSRILIEWTSRILIDPQGFDRTDETVFGTIPIHVMTMLLVPGLPYKWAELRRRLRIDPRDGGTVPYTFRRLAKRMLKSRPH